MADLRAGSVACVTGALVTNSTVDDNGRCPRCGVEVGGLRQHQPTPLQACAVLTDSIADYMATRNTPWPDEAAMREAVGDAVRLVLFDAHHDTREALRTIHGY